MTTPDVPLRMEISLQLEATPDQVWEAIATSNGITSWFLPTDIEERLGGQVVLHMGETSSEGTVTGWDPPRRLEYVEPDWAAMSGHEGAEVTPLVTEFLVEAQSGGTCVLRVVSSAFGTGADWENEFFAEMEEGWTPFFENLRLYVAHFPGERVTSLAAEAKGQGSIDEVWSALAAAVGSTEPGKPVDVRGLGGEVVRASGPPGPTAIFLRLEQPIPGMMVLSAYGQGDEVSLLLLGYLFSPDAPAYVERERPGWQAWLSDLAPTAP
jgi:uncharacterized protein YndB with AHSA1/START domain